MSGFAGRNNQADTGQTKLIGMKVQTTVLGRCIPWVFGTNRVAPNVIQWDDFQAIEKKQKQGGKGGGGESTSYEYKAAVILAICRGPIGGVGTIWADKKKYTTTSLGLDLYTGTDVQTAHPHWATNHAATALPYRGLAYAAKASMDLGSGGSVDRHTFEIKSATRISDTIPDARIENIITALLTDKVDGVGMPAAKLGDLTQMANFCAANSIFASPTYDDQKAAKDALVRLAEIAQCGMFWSDGALKFVPYSDTAATGNGATYTPAVASIPELTADDLLPDGDGPPIKIKRKGAADAKNHFQIKYSDRGNEYNAATIESKDLGSIERFGLLSAEPDEFAEICVGHVAQKLADFRRDRAGAVRTTYEFRLSLRWDRLEPMDIVALTYAPDGMSQVTVRITSIEEGDEGDLRVEAEDCPIGSQQVVQITPQSPAGGGVDYNQSPGNVAAPVMFEPPLSLTGGAPEVWIATSGGPLWGGAEMHVSTDGSTYQRVAEVTAKARHGALTATLPVGGVIDTVNTLAVSLGVSGGVLLAGTTQDATDLSTLCYAGGELLAYRDATLTGVNTYNLQYLVRGAHGTDIAAHAAGSLFTRLDDAVLRYPYDKQWVGRTIYIKFTARNIFGAGQQSLADVQAYTYLITGAPLAGVQNLALLKPWVGGEAQIKWDLVDGATSYDVEALAGAPLATVRSVSNVTSGQWTYSADDARADGGPWRSIALRVRPVAVTGRKGPWTQITASNPQISALAGLSITPMAKQAAFQCTQPADLDFAGIQVWVSTTSPVATTAANLVYDGPDVFTTINKLANGTALAAGTTYYLKAAGYDAFGKDSLAYSSELTFTVAGMVPDVGSVIATMLADGAVTTAKFAAGLEPVSISTAPSLPTTKMTEALTWQGKLYRWSGTAYVASVSAADLTGQVVETQITDNSITAPKIAAGSVVAGKIAAGSITASELAANSVTAGKISAGAVSATEISAGAIRTDKLYVTGNGSELNADPNCSDLSAWVGAGISVANGISDLDMGGATAVQSVSSVRVDVLSADYIPIDSTLNYFVESVIRQVGATAATIFLGVAWYDSNKLLLNANSAQPSGAGYPTGWPSNGNYSYFIANIIAPTIWTKYSLSFGHDETAKIPSNARYMRLASALNVSYAANATIQIGRFGLLRKAASDLIVDGAIISSKILAGAVTTDKVSANAITADKIIASAITTDKIAAGAVTAAHISSGLPGGNLIPNSAFAATYLDAGGLLQADGHIFSTAAVIPVGVLTSGLNLAGAAWQLTGVNTLSLRQTGVDGAGNGAAYADMAGPTWPVVGGQPYEFSFYSGALRCSVTGYVTWRDAAGAVITSTALPTNANETGGGQALSGYKRLFAVAAAPSGAVTAQLTYRKLATLAGQADSWMFAVCPMGAPALSTAQSAPSPWVPTGIGTQISGGIIKTNTLTADKISVTQLSAISANLGDITAGTLNINNRFVVASDGTTTIRSSTTGQRMELDNSQVRVYDSAGVMRVRLGIW